MTEKNVFQLIMNRVDCSQFFLVYLVAIHDTARAPSLVTGMRLVDLYDDIHIYIYILSGLGHAIR